ncbi:MAG: malonyl-CoA synthase [Pseudomonadota bacterium]
MTNHLFDGLFGDATNERPLVRFPDGKSLSYGEGLALSARLANTLVGLGVVAGDRVAVQIPKSFDAIMLYIACARMGAVFLPLNTAYTAGEVEYFLSDAGARLFVCDPSREAELSAMAEANGASLETLGQSDASGKCSGSLSEKSQQAASQFENAECGADSLAAILYTSGTTGRSKGAMLSHNNLLSNARALASLWQFTGDDVLLHALPIFHTHGLFVAVNVTLIAGSSMILLPGFNLDAIIEHMDCATSMMGVPTFYTRLLDDQRFTQELADHMRLFVSGSAPLLAETHVQFEERTGKRILERYGMTETNMNTSNPYVGERRAGTVGFPLPNVELRICDPETGEAVTQGDVGVIEVKGENVFSGYWKMPEKTKEEFRDDGFFITGDLGTIDADGYVSIVGRSKDLIISGGYNIYPKEVELVLDEEEGVLESAVIGVPHPDFGEAVVGVLVASGASLDCEAIKARIAGKIARFKQPKALYVLDELPRNTMGKVQKNALREQFRETFAS